MENTESYGKHGVHDKLWKTRSLTSEKNMENTESYGKHGVHHKNTESDVCQREIWKIVLNNI